MYVYMYVCVCVCVCVCVWCPLPDTFSNLTRTSDATQYTFTESGIAWPSDSSKYKPTAYTPNEVVPPPNWAIYAKYVRTSERARVCVCLSVCEYLYVGTSARASVRMYMCVGRHTLGACDTTTAHSHEGVAAP
jgi:hypothetical protein